MLISRRDVFRGLSAAALFRADAQVTPEIARFRPEIEPLVALIERTPREKCAEMAVEQMRNGVSYRQLMAAVFLAGIRNVNPRPPGFALHCVFIIHSAHLLGMEAPADSRVLPLFYALDNFKTAQDRDARQTSGDYTMRAIRGPLPAGERASAELVAAMDAWDMERAERAIVALARHRSAMEAAEPLWRFGARDYRNIGHKAIFAANAFRTLHTIGWQHAEAVLRSVVLGQLDFGREQKVNGYAFEDQVYLANLKRTKEIFPRLKDDWNSERADRAATLGILSAIREAAPGEASSDAAERFSKGQATAGAVWDAVHLAAAEMRMRGQGSAIVTIHAVTSANALHHAYQAAADPQLRFLLLLQGVGWMGQFRAIAGARDEAVDITALEPAEKSLGAEEVFTNVRSNPARSTAAAFRLARDPAGRPALISAALRYTIPKADEVHYYKYLAALIEDIPLVSPEWQPHLAATIMHYTKGADDPETAPMKRAREALRS